MSLLDEKLMKGAKLCVETCLSVKKGETVLIVSDPENSRKAEAFAGACYVEGAEPIVMMLTPRRLYMKEPVEAVAAAMRSVNVIIITMQPEFANDLYHTVARKKACEAGARVAAVFPYLNWNVTPQEIYETKKQTEHIAHLLAKANTARVTNPAGTNIKMSLKGRSSIALSSIIHKPSESGAIPDYAEAAIAPVEGSADGIVVIDGSIAKIGLMHTPVTFIVRHGRVIEIKGKDEAAELRKIIENADENATTLAELGIGTVPRGKILGVLEDKRLLGTAHFALGDNSSIGGTTKSNIHLDATLLNVTIELDGSVIVEEGKLKV